MTPKLAIVILNWNGKKFLQAFLPTLIEHCPSYAKIVVADNHSTDDSVAFMRAQFPDIQLVINDDNGGFSKGYNTALKQIEAQYYCLLNSDIEVTPRWVEPIIALLDADAAVAAVQPKICSFANKQQFEYAGAAGGFIDRYGYPFCRGRLFNEVEMDNGQYDQPMEVFWATGAAMFVRSNIYHQLGGLDEDFFAHMEEIDFCWRMKNAGYKLMIEPQSVIYHIGGGTLPKNNAFKTFLNFRNNLYLLLKNLPKNRLFITFFVRFFMDNVAALFFLLQGNVADFKAVYKAWWAFLKNYKTMKKKRSGEQTLAYRALYRGSTVFLHYLFRKKKFDGEKFL